MAKLPIEFHPDARTEVLEAFDWYAQHSEAVANSFLAELEFAGNAIQESPELWAAYLHGTRRYLMKRFPFVVVYRNTPSRIEVVAVAHGGRRPGYWGERVPVSDR